ncbi:MAG: hypothetical protein A2W98_01180 [Bacteroidetes bacterium GWF2_33_38]|nr:MAG: hypothetical protein A2W98_01180 [Bacteroidetes bacterium GWF2_33_38]OFY91555.1 MAG: hypothetical protein A2236_10595 [Bacteroidetes bacterium RIFOXYA2_FULL_33_7]HBX50593.1 four helix bundle protein [Bacteroidales bacterium]
MKTHNDLDAWKSSLEFVTQIYKFNETFSKSEEFGLKNQLRQATFSIPLNIAEGVAQNHTKELIKVKELDIIKIKQSNQIQKKTERPKTS